MEIFINYFQLFLVIWARLAAAVMILPILGSPQVPVRVKGLISLMIAILIFPWASQQGIVFPDNTMLFALVIVKEIIVGLVLGFFLALIFASFQLAAAFFSTQIGLGMSEVFDPFTQESSALLGYFFYSVAVLVFLVMGGVHMLIRGVVDTYHLLPVIKIVGHETSLIELGARYFSQMFYIALKIAFPVIVASIIIVVTLGLIGKVAPQANILILGLPLQWGVGIVMILLLIPYMVELFARLSEFAISDGIQYLTRFADKGAQL